MRSSNAKFETPLCNNKAHFPSIPRWIYIAKRICHKDIHVCTPRFYHLPLKNSVSLVSMTWLDLTWSWFYFSSAASVPVAGVGSRRLVLLILAIVIVTRKPVLAVAPTQLLRCQRKQCHVIIKISISYHIICAIRKPCTVQTALTTPWI